MAEVLARRNYEQEWGGDWDNCLKHAKPGWIKDAQETLDFLSAAGFGDVREAGAVALEEAAKDLSWLGAQGNLVHPDTAWAGITTSINALRARAAANRAAALTATEGAA